MLEDEEDLVLSAGGPSQFELASEDPSAFGSTSLDDRACGFWAERALEVQEYVGQLYRIQRDGCSPTDFLRCFLSFSSTSRVVPRDFSLQWEDVCEEELARYQRLVSTSSQASHSIVDAVNCRLDLVRLAPLPVAVICDFMEFTGISRELPFGFLQSFGGWLMHKNRHALLHPNRPDYKCRPRVMVQGVCSMNTAKTPLFESAVGTAIAGTDESEGLPGTHPLLFRDFGDKGAYFALCTQADFNTRMGPSETDGCLFWATDENVLALDTEYAMSRNGRASKSAMKVDFHMLLSTQNGWRFGPVSTKGGKQILVRTTNLGMFHCGQPKCIH